MLRGDATLPNEIWDALETDALIEQLLAFPNPFPPGADFDSFHNAARSALKDGVQAGVKELKKSRPLAELLTEATLKAAVEAFKEAVRARLAKEAEKAAGELKKELDAAAAALVAATYEQALDLVALVPPETRQALLTLKVKLPVALGGEGVGERLAAALAAATALLDLVGAPPFIENATALCGEARAVLSAFAADWLPNRAAVDAVVKARDALNAAADSLEKSTIPEVAADAVKAAVAALRALAADRSFARAANALLTTIAAAGDLLKPPASPNACAIPQGSIARLREAGLRAEAAAAAAQEELSHRIALVVSALEAIPQGAVEPARAAAARALATLAATLLRDAGRVLGGAAGGVATAMTNLAARQELLEPIRRAVRQAADDIKTQAGDAASRIAAAAKSLDDAVNASPALTAAAVFGVIKAQTDVAMTAAAASSGPAPRFASPWRIFHSRSSPKPPLTSTRPRMGFSRRSRPSPPCSRIKCFHPLRTCWSGSAKPSTTPGSRSTRRASSSSSSATPFQRWSVRWASRNSSSSPIQRRLANPS